MILASSKIAESVDDAFLWIGAISLVLLVGITAAMLIFVVRYRRSKHPDAADISGNTKLEITWIVIPTFIVLFMFFKGLEGFKIMRNVPEDAMVIGVEARQWAWSFSYPGVDVISSELYVPVKTPIRLELSSPDDDVVHSFYLPAFRVKEDCVPGVPTYMWFEADEVGQYNIFCAEFCGKDHARMLSRVHALSREDYEKWLDEQIAQRYLPVNVAEAIDPASDTIVQADAASAYKTYCASCHGPEGRGGLVEGARNFRQLDGWKKSAKLDDIYRTLTDGLEGTQMRAFTNLPPWLRIALAHHVRGFMEGGKAPVTSPEDLQKLIDEYELEDQEAPSRSFPIDEAIEARAAEAANGGSN